MLLDYICVSYWSIHQHLKQDNKVRCFSLFHISKLSATPLSSCNCILCLFSCLFLFLFDLPFHCYDGCLFRPSIRLVPSKRTTDVDRMQAQSVMGKQKVVPPSRHSLLSHLSVAHISAAAGNESACLLFFFVFVFLFFFSLQVFLLTLAIISRDVLIPRITLAYETSWSVDTFGDLHIT